MIYLTLKNALYKNKEDHILKKRILTGLLFLFVFTCFSPKLHLRAAEPTIWSRIGAKYKPSKKVNQLILVKYKGGSKAGVAVYDKQNGKWVKMLTCGAYVGKNGINKKKEGDKRTPTGIYNVTRAFGIKKKPVTAMPYTQVNKYMYWCSDKKYYNKLIDIRKTSHRCSNGEHLISIQPQYNYGLVVDYNTDCVYGKGSAIFLHCVGSRPYTAGCIAVTQANMLKILKIVQPGAKICIYNY